MKSGFTLIEILVSVTILLLMSGLLIAGYSTYNTNQVVLQSAATFKNNLNAVRTYAASGIKPTGCTTLVGYRVEFPQANTYRYVAVCLVGGVEQNVGAVVSYTLASGVTFSPVPPSILFQALGRGATPETVVTILSNFKSTKISVLSSGVVSDFLAVATPTPTPIPGSSNTGLLAEFYDDKNLSLFVGSRIDAQINFDWGTAKPFAGLYSADNFSIRWTGYVTVPVTDTYTYIVEVNDGAKLWVNNNKIIDNWGNDGSGRFSSATKNLTAGVPYPIKLEMREQVDLAKVILKWKGKTFTERIVPASAFTQP